MKNISLHSFSDNTIEKYEKHLSNQLWFKRCFYCKCKDILHNVQGSSLRVLVTRTGIEPMFPP